jgi:MYXO-CTERM domain-containing protein
MAFPRAILGLSAATAAGLATTLAHAAVIQVSPADGTMAYKKIEAAGPGDEVVIAPGTYAFRVYLTAQAPADKPIFIHAADPSNPPVWNLAGTLVDNAPGSYTAGDRSRGCWQVSGGTNYHIDGIVFENCHASNSYSAGLRYYNGTSGLLITNCLFKDNDNGLTGGTEDSDATVEFSEFDSNGNTAASASSPTHNIYIYGGTFAIRYSYLHDPVQAQNLHCRAVNSTIEYNWFDRAKSYVGDLMTSDDYANAPSGALVQSMILRGNVIIESAAQANQGQIWAVYNDEASGSPVSFSVTALYNTVIGDGAHAPFLHLSNADGTTMTAKVDDNIVYGTSQPILAEDTSHATITGSNNWFKTGASVTGLTGTIFGTDPGFTNAAADDYTLASGSACIGAADTSVGGLPVYEYFQNETVTRMYRVRASALDVGAFEHTTSGPGIGPYGADGGVVVPVTTADGGTGGSTTGPDGGIETTPGSGSSGSGGGSGSGGSSGSSAASNDAGPGASSDSSGGCGCRTAAIASPRGIASAWALGLAAFLVRRRRRA